MPSSRWKAKRSQTRLRRQAGTKLFGSLGQTRSRWNSILIIQMPRLGTKTRTGIWTRQATHIYDSYPVTPFPVTEKDELR